MQNLFNEITGLLATDSRYLVDDQLSKEKVVQAALAMDKELLALLLSQQSLKDHFFVDVQGTKVFDKVLFQRFILNKDFLPDSFTQYANKVGLRNLRGFISESQDVELVWPFKDAILEGGQDKDDAKREEIFWNLTLAPDQIDHLLAPKVFTNFERYGPSAEIEAVSGISHEANLLIKGNNLLTLHSLLPVYRGKVDLVYIDPPYNPDSKNNTFTYNNSFNRSTWLTFMKNRLDVAKQLLTESGSLICAIDENEHVHLGVLLKEIFVNHEVHCITVVHNPRGIQGTNFSYTHEYAFFVIPKGKSVIGKRPIADADIEWRNLRDNGGESERSDAKNCFYPIIVRSGQIVGFGDVVPDGQHPRHEEVHGEDIYVYPVDSRGVERKWRYARQSVESVQSMLRARKLKSGVIEIEIGKNFGTFRTVWNDDARYDANEYGTKLLKSLVPDAEFLFPKSLWTVYDCLLAVIGSNKSAIVLDFFAGSGTTGQAVLELNKQDGGNRRFILCEQMDYVETVTKARLKEVVRRNGADSFIYMEIAKLNQVFVERIADGATMADLEVVWTEMQESSFLSYKLPPALEEIRNVGFEGLSLPEVRTFLLAVLDHNMLYVPVSEIRDATHGIAQEVIEINEDFYGAAK